MKKTRDALGATNELDVARATLTAAAAGLAPLWAAVVRDYGAEAALRSTRSLREKEQAQRDELVAV
jgi:hypothetical protein